MTAPITTATLLPALPLDEVAARAACLVEGAKGLRRRTAKAARAHDIELEVVKLPEAKCSFVHLPRRWVVERSFVQAKHFRRLVKDYECYPSTLADLHIVIFVRLVFKWATQLVGGS